MEKAKRLLDPNSPIANFVKAKRKALGYTQEQFALRVGVGLNFIRDIEQGKISIRLDKANEVMNFFGYELVPQIKHEFA
jgi:y4mF family transcriptional regulator